MGGGGSSSSGIDAEYNDRMATIAENYKDWADQYGNFYKYGTFTAPSSGETGTTAAPSTTDAGLSEGQSASAERTATGQPKFIKKADGTVMKYSPAYGGMYVEATPEEAAAFSGAGGGSGATGSSGGVSTVPVPEDAISYANMEKKMIAANMKLIPLQTEAGTEAIKSALTYDPMQVGAKAANTVMQQGGIQQGALRREAGRTGIDPNSGQYISMLGDLNLATQKNAAFAKTTAEQLAEQEKWKRLAQIGSSIQ